MVIFLSERLDFNDIHIEWRLTFALKVAQSSNVVLSNCASVYKRSHEFVSVCESVGVGSDSIASNNKLSVKSVVRSKFGGVILLNY